jgi:hypothetical protein
MHDIPLAERERRFVEQNEIFVEKVLKDYALSDPGSWQLLTSRKPLPIQPVLLNDYRNLTSEERQQIREAYFSVQGVAYYIALNPSQPSTKHPLLEIANQLKDDLNLHYPLTHPLEGHPDTLSRFGPADETVKIYDLIKKDRGYREQGETADMFSMHSYGLGSGGTVHTTALYMDSAPLSGGYTFFQNIPVLALELAKHDIDAFKSLFLPDALTQIRPRGKGALKVVSPVLFLNEKGDAQTFFRTSTGEYQIKWRRDLPALERAMAFLNRHAEPFSLGSSFVHLTERGHGCFIRNQVIAHGRTAFVDGPLPSQKRVLSRKWFMVSERDATYKHVPGMFILKRYADLIPELFSPEFLEGEWLYDSVGDKNLRIK